MIDTRPARGTMRRRRQCDVCGSRFTTYETVEPGSAVASVAYLAPDLDARLDEVLRA